jgi:hypothetical protein
LEFSSTTPGLAPLSWRLRAKNWEQRVRHFVRKWRQPPPPVLPLTWDAGEVTRPTRPDRLQFPGSETTAVDQRLLSCLCRTEFLESPAFRYWAEQLHEAWRLHRKLWEYCYVCQALFERGMLRPGCRGLGFAVGQEPLPAFFAALGCEIVATDLAADDQRTQQWAQTAQWARNLQSLNERGLCEPEAFRQRVQFRPVDMNYIPGDLRDFDFTWSSCSFEHCGSIQLGQQFLRNQLQCLRPGGIAVHTTEFNLTSNSTTLTEGVTVIFRHCDIDQMVAELRGAGHTVEPLDLALGDAPLDRYVDTPPYSHDKHLRLHLGDWATTSLGLIVRKGAA